MNASAANIPSNLKADGNSTPLAIESMHPRLTWILPETGLRNVSQVAYQIQAVSDEAMLLEDNPNLWDSDKQEGQITACYYQGGMPPVGKTVYWRVRVWLKGNSSPSSWSEATFFENGLLQDNDWKGQWIGMQKEVRGNSAPYLRGRFTLSKSISSARAYVCGLGWSELYVNGQKIGDGVMDPAQTDYELKTFYMVYDITNAVKSINSQTVEVGVLLGDGWYNQ